MQNSKLNNTGSVCVEICITVVGNGSPDLGQRVQVWIDNVWIPNNLEWVRVFTGRDFDTVAERQILMHENDFLRSPEVILKDNSKLLVRLYVKCLLEIGEIGWY